MRHRWLRASVLFVCFAAAVTTGYLVSARLGAEALRLEAQEQLGDLLQGSVRIARARLVLRGGLFIEGDRVGVYPSEAPPHRPALFASHVSAELDVLALLLGRFRLNGLLIDDAVLEIRRLPDGRWTPTPFQLLADRDRRGSADDMERSLDLIHAFEAVTRTLLESPLIARRVELRRSRITFVDRTRRISERPIELVLYQVNGRLVHHWLSGDADLRLGAALVDSEQRAVPLRAEGWQRGGDAMRLALTGGRLPLATLEPYLVPADGRTRLGGALSGEIAYETRAEQHGTVTLQADIDNLETTVDVRDGHYEIERQGVALSAALEIHPGRVRLAEGRIDGAGIAFTLGGAIDRPIGPSSRARFEVDVDGVELEEVREIVRSLPDKDGTTLEGVLGRVEEGRIDRIGARGTARIDEWGPLLVGEAERLPRGFVLSATVSEVRARAGLGDWLVDVGGRIELSGDRFELKNASGLWNDEPLPKLAVSVHGVSRLLRGSESMRALGADAEEIPGLSPLRQILRGDPNEHSPTSAPATWLLEVTRLDHPMLIWPVTDARVVVDGTRLGLKLAFERGRWAGAPFDAEALWITEPEEALVVDVRVHPWDARPGDPAAPGHSRARSSGRTRKSGRPNTWASGRFEMGGSDGGPLRMRGAAGRFSLTGSRLELLDVRADLAPHGTLSTDVELDLANPEQVGTTFAFDIQDADVDQLGQAIGLPRGFATGRIGLTGHAEGPIRPQTPLLTSLYGETRIAARKGEVRRDELPLVLALAQASAGYNEYAARDAVAFDSVQASFEVAEGLITTQDFELDGPLRVYGSGSVDVVHPPYEMNAVFGLFLFRSAGQIMETIPLVKAILPGSEKGLVGAYFQVSGPFESPTVDALAGKSLAEDLPDVLAAPYRVLRSILKGGEPDGGHEDGQRPAKQE